MHPVLSLNGGSTIRLHSEIEVIEVYVSPNSLIEIEGINPLISVVYSCITVGYHRTSIPEIPHPVPKPVHKE